MSRAYFSVGEQLAKNDECLNPCNRVDYTARIQSQRFTENAITIEVLLGSDQISIFQEYLLFDFPTFVGSVGGSLGLFIGFSYFDFASMITDYLYSLNNK